MISNSNDDVAFPLSPVQPLERAQKLFLRFAAFESGSNLEGGVVTAVFKLPPVRRLYLATPFAVICTFICGAFVTRLLGHTTHVF